jgi:hypothetical protein
MNKDTNTTGYNQEEFAKYAAPVLLQMASMARRAKKDFAGYLLEMAATELVEKNPR